MSSMHAFGTPLAEASLAEALSWPSRARARWAVVALAATCALANFDRAIITLVGEHMRRDLGLSDAQFGLVSGLAFALPLALIAVPVGRLADRTSRKVNLISGVAFWSAMTAMCGLVRTFGALVVARIGVGAGEAAIAPTAVPLLADYHPPERRSRAISGYYVGAHLGQALAFIAGGALVAWLDQRPVADAPIIGRVASWQLLFPIAGAFGLLIMAFLFAMAEPARREKLRPADQRALPARETVRFVRQRSRAFAAVLLSPALFSIGFSGLLVFLPSLMQRAHGLPVSCPTRCASPCRPWRSKRSRLTR